MEMDFMRETEFQMRSRFIPSLISLLEGEWQTRAEERIGHLRENTLAMPTPLQYLFFTYIIVQMMRPDQEIIEATFYFLSPDGRDAGDEDNTPFKARDVDGLIRVFGAYITEMNARGLRLVDIDFPSLDKIASYRQYWRWVYNEWASHN